MVLVGRTMKTSVSSGFHQIIDGRHCGFFLMSNPLQTSYKSSNNKLDSFFPNMEIEVRLANDVILDFDKFHFAWGVFAYLFPYC